MRVVERVSRRERLAGTESRFYVLVIVKIAEKVYLTNGKIFKLKLQSVFKA